MKNDDKLGLHQLVLRYILLIPLTFHRALILYYINIVSTSHLFWHHLEPPGTTWHQLGSADTT